MIRSAGDFCASVDGSREVLATRRGGEVLARGSSTGGAGRPKLTILRAEVQRRCSKSRNVGTCCCRYVPWMRQMPVFWAATTAAERKGRM
jgi:hypothetical protein